MCCLFGLIDYKGALSLKQKNRIIKELSIASEARGTDATGIAYNASGKIHIYKRPREAHKLQLHIPNDAKVIMGHTRMATQGSEKKNHNNHPFLGKAGKEKFALAHNGVLYNDFLLRNSEKLPKSKIETDSYVAVQLLEQKNTLHLSTMQQMAEKVEGTFVFTILDEKNQLTFIKGDNPICIYHFKRLGVYLYASTEEILCRATKYLGYTLGKYEAVIMNSGDILQIDSSGKQQFSHFDSTSLYYDARYGRWPIFKYGIDFLTEEDEYVIALKTTATAHGYTADDIDHLLADGFTPEEIEGFLYEGVL